MNEETAILQPPTLELVTAEGERPQAEQVTDTPVQAVSSLKLPKQPKLKKKDFSFRDYCRDNTNWKKIHKTLIKMAIGGTKYTNGNNTTSVTLPDHKAMALLLEYSWGKPVTLNNEDVDTVDALKAFKDFVKGPIETGVNSVVSAEKADLKTV